MTSHATTMDAAGYWRDVRTSFYFDKEEVTIAGTVLELLPRPKKDDPPGFWLQTAKGHVFQIVARQARLKFELKKAAPAPGDHVSITYNGEADKSAPGMNPAKEFTVVVTRQGSRSPAGTETVRGSAASDNGSETGK